jgi:hypothetical protein
MSIDSGIGGDEDSDRAAWDAIFRTQVGSGRVGLPPLKASPVRCVRNSRVNARLDETDAALRCAVQRDECAPLGNSRCVLKLP